MNPLEAYRTDKGLSYQQLGKLLETTTETARRCCKSDNIPRADLMRRIYMATQGQVQPNDFYDLPSLTPSGLKQLDRAGEGILDGGGQVGPLGEEARQDGGALAVRLRRGGHGPKSATPPGDDQPVSRARYRP